MIVYAEFSYYRQYFLPKFLKKLIGCLQADMNKIKM